jgi:AcrR family transcriptional regulator
MTEAGLTAERILDAAEEVLRRFGPAKATVVDVARALGVSHGSVYRHFSSKAALRDAVMGRWLDRVSAPLAAIAEEQGPAAERLRRWFDLLLATKRRKVLDDPELFATYQALKGDAGEAIGRHVEHLDGQLARIIGDGIAEGAFAATDPGEAAAAVFDATARFHNPAHAGEWSDPAIDAAFERVWTLVLAGLRGGPAGGR